MNDNELIEALALCISGEVECRGCKISKLCTKSGYGVWDIILPLVKRQQAEIERLREIIKE